MNNDLEAMIAAAKAGTGGPPGDVPLLGQQPPILRGIPVNGGLLTINEIEKMSDREFRELFLGVIVNMLGGVYAPAPKPEEENLDESDPED